MATRGVSRVHSDRFLDRLAARCTCGKVEPAVVLRAFDLWSVGPIDDGSTRKVDLSMSTSAVNDAHRAIVGARHGKGPVAHVDTSNRSDRDLFDWAEVERSIRADEAD